MRHLRFATAAALRAWAWTAACVLLMLVVGVLWASGVPLPATPYLPAVVLLVSAAGAALFTPQTAAPACVGCRHFDHAEGQRIFARFPSFPAAHLSPDQVGAVHHHELAQLAGDAAHVPPALDAPAAAAGSIIPILHVPPALDAPLAPAEATRRKLGDRPHTWGQYGLCVPDRVLCNAFDHCAKFRPRRRLHRPDAV